MNTLAPSHTNPVLGDGRTTLRRFTTADADAFAAIHGDPLNIKWTASDAAMTVRAAGELIDGSIAAGWEDGRYLRFAICEKFDGVPEVVGTLSVQDIFSTLDGGSASVGIKMLPAGRGTGTAQRAIELLCGYAFGNLGLEILHWRTTDGNTASAELAKRCGFVLAAQIPGYGHVAEQVADGLMFTQSREQFASSTHPAPEPVPLDMTAVVPVLRNDAVVLRALSMADAPVLVENCVNPEAVRWTTVPLGYTMEHAEYFINTITPDGWRTGETLSFAVAHPATDELLGTVDLQCKNPGAAAIGINFGAHARGTGAAEAAVRLLLDYAFNQLNLSWVHWTALVPNWGSRKLAWKLGFHFDGHIRGDYNDRGTPSDRWILSLAAGDERTPQEPWTGPAPRNR
ncbi:MULTISPECIES: GNAT family N-acetyltransferase [Arthrobacter]|uniref:GNAT family N-acetyltransferase n=1 Tax=Arthrobacter TaxID=1663 RepID=UPI00053624B8|nr:MULTISPECIES: GNAT family protein [Arthrobacter]AIY03866.1 hypothetical protein ART_4267 [Arthrobacter sp. PAMC 25486]